MNWIRENKFLTGYLAVLLILAGVLTYAVLDQKTAWSTAEQEYEGKVSNLTSLRALTPYRDSANLAKIEEQQAEYAGLVNQLQSRLTSQQAKIVPMDPSAFQGRLRESVSRVADLARSKGVELPSDFYLGFGRYQMELPRNEVTGLLDWQLTIIETLVTKMINLKIPVISEILRAPLPGEFAVEAAPKTPPLLIKYPMEIGFSSRQDQFQSLLNQISTAGQFMIVRALRVENEQRLGPPRTLPGTEGADAALGGSAAESEAAKKAAAAGATRIIAGTELVKAQIIFDLVQFTPPADATAVSPKKN